MRGYIEAWAVSALEPYTRRDFFRRAGVLGAWLAMACESRAGGGEGEPLPDRMRAIGEAVLGLERGESSGAPAAPFDPSRMVEVVRRLFPKPEIDLLKVADWLSLIIEYQPWCTGYFKRFSALPRDKQEEVLKGWVESRSETRRLLIILLRTLCSMSHYSHHATWGELGYDGPWIGRIPIPHEPVRVAGVLSADDPAVPERLSAHTVVIGFGAGGGVLATELAERGVEVLALEAGPYLTSDGMTQREEEMIPWLFRDFGMRQTRDRGVNIVQGQGVGGSTVHNINLCYRAPEWILEEWAERSGLDLFRGGGMNPYYERVEDRIRVNRIPEQMVNRNNRITWDGATKLGWAAEIARHNRTNCLGSGFCEIGCAYDRKNNVAVAYLPSFVEHGGRIVSRCKVDRIVMEGKAVRSIEAVSMGGRRLTIDCKRVVVSAGGIDTPAILIRSGLKDRNAWIGRGLHLHPGTTVAGLFEEPVEGWRGIPQSVVVTEFLAPRPEGAYVIVSAFAHPLMFGAMVPGVGRFHRELMTNYRYIAAVSPFIHDRTEGEVEPDGEGRPRIAYELTEPDCESLRDSWVKGAEILLAAGARRLLLAMPEGVILEGRDQVARIRGFDVRKSPLVSVHPQSACRMASDPGRGAVDEGCALFGWEGVYVCDTSLYPDSIGSPPQLTAMALGARLGERLALDP
ncbi:MAG: GMC family oxidoreductase [Nitrospirae bacterium]|nr:GMC family oxidoreductase [Nitrospirota bacterium]